MEKKRSLVILGDSAFAEIAYEYFTVDSPWEVTAFAVERPFLRRESLFGLPVVPFEDLPARYPPDATDFFAAVVYTEGNRLRERLVGAATQKGYRAASFVSPHAFVWRNVELGEHTFVFEHNVLQPFCRIGSNVILWSGNHVGHHARIGAGTFVSSHVVISGFVTIGERCFLGVNATLANNISIGNDVTIAAGATVFGDVPDGTTVVGTWRGKRAI